MNITNAFRRARAIEVRDHVLPLISERGALVRQPMGERGFITTARWSCALSGETLPEHAKDRAFLFILVTPFGGANALTPASYAHALAKQRFQIERPDLGYCLDVFWQGRAPCVEWDADRRNDFVVKPEGGKVLSLEWDADGRAQLMSMRPGPWEAEALALQ